MSPPPLIHVGFNGSLNGGDPPSRIRSALSRPSAPWWTQQKGKEYSRQEEEGNNVRNQVLGRLRRLPERFGRQEADQQWTDHDGGNPV